MINTRSFVGGSLEMAGCRSCYWKSVEDMHLNYDENKAGICRICDSDGNSSDWLNGIDCGATPSTLDKLTELQTSNQECKNGMWRFKEIRTGRM